MAEVVVVGAGDSERSTEERGVRRASGGPWRGLGWERVGGLGGLGDGSQIGGSAVAAGLGSWWPSEQKRRSRVVTKRSNTLSCGYDACTSAPRVHVQVICLLGVGRVGFDWDAPNSFDRDFKSNIEFQKDFQWGP